MRSGYLRIVVMTLATLLAIGAFGAHVQDTCRAAPDSVALADKLFDRAGEQFEGGDPQERSSAWAKVRRAVELAPLNHDRLGKILQLARFLNRPDSAIAFANLAVRRWPVVS